MQTRRALALQLEPQRPVPAHPEQLLTRLVRVRARVRVRVRVRVGVRVGVGVGVGVGVTRRCLSVPLTRTLRAHHRCTPGRLRLMRPGALRALDTTPRAPRPRGRGAGGVGAMSSGALRSRRDLSPLGLRRTGRLDPSGDGRCGRRRPRLLPALLLRGRLPHPRLLRLRLRCRRDGGLRGAPRADRVDPVRCGAGPALCTHRPAKPRRSASGVSRRHSGSDAGWVGEPATAHRG